LARFSASSLRTDSGFRYAFSNGADFICVGMFDFQVEQNVSLVKIILPQSQNRERDWMA
jgi:hypothetical protein